jgi:IMP dehydrogenase/GMP reductase
MATIQFRGDDAAFMQDLSAQLAQDLQRVGLAADVHLTTPINEETTRGDPVIWGVVATAVAAGGALTAFLGKDGGLSALAKVLETYIASRKVEVNLETDDGKKVKVSGSLAAIKAVLKEV